MQTLTPRLSVDPILSSLCSNASDVSQHASPREDTSHGSSRMFSSPQLGQGFVRVKFRVNNGADVANIMFGGH